MLTIFTICSNNYLGQAIVLGKSLKVHHPEATFSIFLVDRKSDEVDYAQIPFEVIPVESIEPELDQLAAKYDIVELNTCVKPRIIEHLFVERGVQEVIYLDPDIKVYAPLSEVTKLLQTSNIVLIPHALTPIPLDGKRPTEIVMLHFGVFNLGFIALRRNDETIKAARWWKDRTYTAGYSRPEDGMFTDQLFTNLLPIFFRDVAVLRHPGYNMAPWNLHERRLTRTTNGHRVNDSDELAFYHFSSFRFDSMVLPAAYNRFTLEERPDIAALYSEYNADLKASGYERYSKVRWAWGRAVAATPFGILKKRARRLVGKGILWGLGKVPVSMKQTAYRVLRDTRG